MTFTFLSNYLNHHQIPFCTAMCTLLNKNFHFISTIPMEDERKNMGWGQQNTAQPFEIMSYESEEKHERSHALAFSSDVAVIGSAPDRFIVPRLKSKKLTFKYVERFYKTGTPRSRWFRDAIAAWLHHGRFQKYPLYLLCASAYTAADAARFGNYKNRAYKWGYFPATKTYDLPALMAEKSPTTILWAGRFLDWKHPDDALTVAKRLKDDGFSFRLNIIGVGEMEEAMRQMIADNHLDDCVQMLGSMPPEEVRRHMEKAGIYLFTSDRYEGWGAVLNESMNSGCAVVASHAIGAVPFLLKNGENGLLYRSGDVDMLYNKVKYLLEYPQQQRSLGEAAYKTITETWNAEEAARRFLQLSEAILSGEKYPDLFPDGPCSRAEILKDDWFTHEK